MSAPENTSSESDSKQTPPPAVQEESCPLCPSSGPPQPPNSETRLDLVWIACTKCSTWFHSACLLLADEAIRSTIPKEIVEEVEQNRKDEGAWFNWTQWIDKWYCQPCIERASDPTNPRPPRYPLTATLKKGLTSFETAKPKRSASSTSLAQLSKQPKKSRISLPNQNSEITSPKTPRVSIEHNNKQPKKSRNSITSRNSETIGSKTPDESIEYNDIESNQDTKFDGDIITYTGTMQGEETQVQDGRPKRNIKQLDYNNLNNSVATPTNQWLDLIADPAKYGRVILDAKYKSVPGKLLSRSWLDSSTNSNPDYPPTLFYGQSREPIIVRSEDGGFTSMGGQIPGKDLTVQDVARLVGPKRMVDVIDVSSQQSSQWTLQKWADYLNPPSSSNPSTPSSSARRKVYNIISLEISDTELGKKVKPPRLVREIDWVDNFWNFSLGGKSKGKGKATPTPDGGSVNGDFGEEIMVNGVEEDLSDLKGQAKSPYPKVQLYCLMGMKGAWTDWHVDFAASSVYYTIHTGSKVFYFIRPTTENLKAYAQWSGSYEKQQDTWLPDMCDEVRKVVLKAGDTMIIPAGYIHAVYTPMDSIVFGGNFLHSYDIDTQLRLRQIEIDTKVPQRFRFPMFEKLCWFVADRYTTQLRQLRAYRPRSSTQPPNPFQHCVLSQLTYLTNFLLNQISILHNPEKEERSKKLVWDRIPHELIKDPEGLARELKWRILRELGEDDTPASNGSSNANGVKVENGDMSHKDTERELKGKKMKLSKIFDKKGSSRTWLFDPPKWNETITPAQVDSTTIRIAQPSSHSANGEREEAKMYTSTIKQLRTRITEVEDGGMVQEEQEVIFHEKRIVWGAREENVETDKQMA